jgi:hypothetical protein
MMIYILDQQEQQKLIDALHLVEKLEGGWRLQYLDPASQQSWVLFYAYPEDHGGGFPILRTDPPPVSLNEWLGDCLVSDREDDVKGIALEFRDRYDLWSQVLDWIESNLSMIPADNLLSFLSTLTILNPRNRMDILGKHYSEIQKDHDHFVRLLERAKNLMGSV